MLTQIVAKLVDRVKGVEEVLKSVRDGVINIESLSDSSKSSGSSKRSFPLVIRVTLLTAFKTIIYSNILV